MNQLLLWTEEPIVIMNQSTNVEHICYFVKKICIWFTEMTITRIITKIKQENFPYNNL